MRYLRLLALTLAACSSSPMWAPCEIPAECFETVRGQRVSGPNCNPCPQGYVCMTDLAIPLSELATLEAEPGYCARACELGSECTDLSTRSHPVLCTREVVEEYDDDGMGGCVATRECMFDSTCPAGLRCRDHECRP